MSDAIVRASDTHYGNAGRAFLEQLTRDQRDWEAQYTAFKRAPEFTVEDADGQVKRAASKFALVAMAGELAIESSCLGPREQRSPPQSSCFMLEAGRGVQKATESRLRC